MTVDDNQAKTLKWLIICIGALLITLIACVTCYNVFAVRTPVDLQIDMMNAGYVQEMRPDHSSPIWIKSEKTVERK